MTIGKSNGLVLLRHGVDWLVANRALGLVALRLIKDNIVPTVGTDPAAQFVRAHVNGVPAGAVYFFVLPLKSNKPLLACGYFPHLGHLSTNLDILRLYYLCFGILISVQPDGLY